MDTVIPDDIALRLHRFATAVQETRIHAAERSSFGRYRAGAPYFEQYPLRQLMDSGEGNALFTPALRQEFGRISADLLVLEQEGGKAYRNELFRDLSHYTEAYRTMLCYHELGLCSAAGISHDPLREEIAVLLHVLEGECSTADISALVASLDDAFRSFSVPTCMAVPDPYEEAAGGGIPVPVWQRQCRSHLTGERTGPL
jgi:hypothetical protein